MPHTPKTRSRPRDSSRVGRSAARRVLLTLLLGTVGCGTAGTPFQEGSTSGNEVAVHAAVVRFITTHYEPAARAGTPAAWCLAVGRRAGQAVNSFRREADEPWNPSPRLLSRVSEVEPRVIPVSQCGQDDGLQERVLETDEPAVLLILSHPSWDTHETATVVVGMRESPTFQDRAVCRLTRGSDDWRVRDCV